jgi:epoxyqueuosine reductase
MTTPTVIPFPVVAAACAHEGLTALAVLAPPPQLLAGDALALMLEDGVGDLGWLSGQQDLRLRPTAMMPTAQAILCVAWDYQPTPGDGTLRRARYAAGKDYHVILRHKLHRAGTTCAPGHRLRAVVDSAPLNERTLARLAGLGWIGRNALLIHPQAGSYRLLGFLLTSAPLAAYHGEADSDRCGTCRACEVRCPTAALRDRRCLTTRCISYLTIEHQGVIARDLALRFEGWWFGCDLCQEACPWNRFAQGPADPRLGGSEDDARLLAVGPGDFDQIFAGRAIRRAGYARFRRNLLCALASLGRWDEARALAAEDLPLVRAQAAELGLDRDRGAGPSPPCA